MTEESSSKHADEESTLTHAALGHHTDPQAVNDISIQIQPLATPNEDTKPEGDNDRRDPTSEPPWRCDKRIYESRFVRSCFWGSQLGILSLTALFVVFYFELFVLLGVPSLFKLHATLETDFGIWFIVGSTILAWLGVGMVLLIGGAMFSSLFKLEVGSSDQQAS